MKSVFADTFYFLALLNERDPAHAPAADASRGFKGRIVTTAWVLTEVADAMSERRNRAEFLGLLHDLRRNPRAVIVPPTEDLFERGVALYAERPDKDWSLTDCISFVVMRDTSITEALTGDRHFEQAGFTALLE
ncbi:unnamed protein product [marine sediment metagenome]|uniref:PIN domain-containing protein n=1 Tax=marine sediment metagenome TaxID=412755 RepID=X0Y3I6_9ZZZZ